MRNGGRRLCRLLDVAHLDLTLALLPRLSCALLRNDDNVRLVLEEPNQSDAALTKRHERRKERCGKARTYRPRYEGSPPFVFLPSFAGAGLIHCRQMTTFSANVKSGRTAIEGREERSQRPARFA